MISFPGSKINLGLFVTEKQPNGYHNLQSIFLPTSYSDLLEVNGLKEGNKDFFVQTGLTLPDVKQGYNLVEKARDLFRSFFYLPPVSIHLHKIVPFGAGLGGGSADAAHTLLALAKISPMQPKLSDLNGLAQQLGADCSFFLQNQTAYLNGIGHELTPIELHLKGWYLAIVHAHITIPTAWAFSKIKPKNNPIDLLSSIQLPVSTWKDTIINDFETVVFDAYPLVKSIKEKLYSLGATFALMTGSGSAVYALFENDPKNLSQNFENYTFWSAKID